MFKKIFLGAGIVTVLALVFVGPSAFSHAKRAFSWARESVKDAVPLEYQLEDAERSINEIIPEIEASKQVVAQEQVEIRYLGDEISRLERLQAMDQDRIQAQGTALKNARVDLVVAGRTYPRSVIENEVRIALKKHQHNAALLESKKRLLDARQRSLIAAQKKLDTVCGEKENLAIAVEQLRAQLRETQALEATTCRIDLDDSKLAEVKSILGRVKKRLDVAQQLLENDGTMPLESPAEASTGDVSLEVEQYFGTPAGTPSESRATAAAGR